MGPPAATAGRARQNNILMRPVAVMQLCDSLAPGGLERVAVNIANHLPRARYQSHLCTTRSDGVLAAGLAGDVRRLRLGRQVWCDPWALARLGGYIHQGRIRLLHAHGTALFVAAVAALFPPWPRLLWHDHYGCNSIEQRSRGLYRWATRRVSGVIAVNDALAAWARDQLGVPADRVWYVPNFVSEPGADTVVPVLPGNPGQRVVCVANLRPEKDHPGLLAAMRLVLARQPAAHLILVGTGVDRRHTEELCRTMREGILAGHVHWLGSSTAVAAVLWGCDVGVLSSAAEGLPMALLEYGLAGLPSVATAVGQCAEVLDQGRAGLLVPPADPAALAAALVRLLESPGDRVRLGRQLQQRIRNHYSVQAGIGRVAAIYEQVLGPVAR